MKILTTYYLLYASCFSLLLISYFVLKQKCPDWSNSITESGFIYFLGNNFLRIILTANLFNYYII